MCVSAMGEAGGCCFHDLGEEDTHQEPRSLDSEASWLASLGGWARVLEQTELLAASPWDDGGEQGAGCGRW